MVCPNCKYYNTDVNEEPCKSCKGFSNHVFCQDEYRLIKNEVVKEYNHYLVNIISQNGSKHIFISIEKGDTSDSSIVDKYICNNYKDCIAYSTTRIDAPVETVKIHQEE